MDVPGGARYFLRQLHVWSLIICTLILSFTVHVTSGYIQLRRQESATSSSWLVPCLWCIIIFTLQCALCIIFQLTYHCFECGCPWPPQIQPLRSVPTIIHHVVTVCVPRMSVLLCIHNIVWSYLYPLVFLTSIMLCVVPPSPLVGLATLNIVFSTIWGWLIFRVLLPPLFT